MNFPQLPNRRPFWIALACSNLLALCGAAAQSESPRFVDATAASGISFVHQDAGNDNDPKLYQLMSAGLASLDFDNDGRMDVYLLNGVTLPLPDLPAQGNALFKNVTKLPQGPRQVHFTEVSASACVDERRYGLGVTAADYNNDGFEDLYISNYGENALLRNNGDGTFSNATAHAQVGDGSKFGAGVVFLDIDLDGDLDLFVGNYVQFSHARHQRLAQTAFPFPPGPKDFAPEADSLYRNEGAGQFSDISWSSGIAQVQGPSMGAIATDVDSDGNLDLFVACDGAPSHLFVNDGQGNFAEAGVMSGLAYDVRGDANGSMGVDAADINGDGIEDLFVTDYANQIPMFFQSAGPGFFDDQSQRSDFGKSLLPHVNWGVGFGDWDNDADQDLFIANGHFLKDTTQTHPGTSFAVANSVLENDGNGRFRVVSGSIEGSLPQSSRGIVIEDFDSDGDLDSVILNCDAHAQFLSNESPHTQHWLQIELIGTSANRSATGARVILSNADFESVALVHSGRGYQSHFGRILHFGLGRQPGPNSLKIVWPSGRIQSLEAIPVDRKVTLVEPK